MTPVDADEWIRLRGAEDGPPTWWDVARVPRILQNTHCYVEAPDEGSLRGYRKLIACDDRYAIGIEIGSESRALKYVASDGTVWHIPTAAGGVLEHLRALAHKVAAEAGWFEAEAATYVLTGEPPSVPLIRETIVRRPDRPEPGGDRITLEINPRVSPRAVTQRYTVLRREQMRRTRSSAHTVDARYAAILGFWQDHGDCNQHERVRQWNAAYPEWHINVTQPNALRQLYVRAYRWFYGQRPLTSSSPATP